jgi:hypothetical protein
MSEFKVTFKFKLYREIEKLFKVKKGTLQKSITDLKVKHKKTNEEIAEIAEMAVAYCNDKGLSNGESYAAALSLYVGCLNNPKSEKAF